MGAHPRRALRPDTPGLRQTRRGARRRRRPGADLGPPQLRRVRRVLRRRQRVEPARRHDGRPPRPPGHGAGDRGRRVGRCPGVACSPPSATPTPSAPWRCGGSAAVRPSCSSSATTTACRRSGPPGDDGMDAVVDLPDWAEQIERNPANRQRILDQDRAAFIATMERWIVAYAPREGETIPGPARRPDAGARPAGAGVQQRRERPQPPPRHHRARRRGDAARPPGRAALGRPRVVRAPGRAGDTGGTGGLFVRWPLPGPGRLTGAGPTTAAPGWQRPDRYALSAARRARDPGERTVFGPCRPRRQPTCTGTPTTSRSTATPTPRSAASGRRRRSTTTSATTSTR